jgi:hypothetical protein
MSQHKNPCRKCGEPIYYGILHNCDEALSWKRSREAHAELMPTTPEPTTPEVTAESPAFRAFVSRVEKSFLVAALAFLAVTSSALADHTQCYQSGHTGEGFPVISCPAEGTTYYVDLDGTDGTLGTEGDGRWIEIR